MKATRTRLLLADSTQNSSHSFIMCHSKSNSCVDIDDFSLFSFDQSSDDCSCAEANITSKLAHDDVDQQQQNVDNSWFFDEKLVMFDDFIRSPPPSDNQQQHQDTLVGQVFEIASDQQQQEHRKRPDPTDVEQQLKHQRILKNFTRSMQKSDETRTIIKRQRPHTGCSRNFFASSECKELEKSRKELFRVLNQEIAEYETSMF